MGNYNLIERLLKDFTDINDFVQSFELSFDDQRSKWSENEKLFPTIYGVVRNVQNTEYTINWNIDVFVLDNLTQDRSNEKSIMNTTQEIGNQFINYVRDYYREYATFNVDPTLNPLNNFDNNRMNGWRINMTIETKREQCYIGSEDTPIIPQIGEQVILRYLTCDTLGNCTVFTGAIDDLQQQIDGLSPDNFYTTQAYLDNNILRFDRTDLTDAYSVDLSTVLFSGDYNDLINKPTNLSDFNNDENFINCTTINDCPTIQTIQSDIINIENELNVFYIGLNFIDLEPFNYVAPETFKVTSIDNPDSLIVTITVNGSSYTIGNTITLYDDVEVTVSGIGFIKLNCEIV